MDTLNIVESAFGIRLGNNFRPILISIAECCYLLGISRATFYRRQKEDGFPKARKNGRRSQVRLTEAEEWANKLKPSSTIGG